MKEAGLDPAKPGFLGTAIEMRFVGGSPWRASDVSQYRAWVRPRVPLPAEPAFHAAALAFLADLYSHVPTARRIGYHFEPFGYTSLDQVVWVHRANRGPTGCCSPRSRTSATAAARSHAARCTAATDD